MLVGALEQMMNGLHRKLGLCTAAMPSLWLSLFVGLGLGRATFARLSEESLECRGVLSLDLFEPQCELLSLRWIFVPELGVRLLQLALEPLALPKLRSK